MTTDKQLSFGIIGLGTMGRNLLLNMADHGVAVAGYNRHEDKVALLMKESNSPDVYGFLDLKDFINSLKTPRVVMLLVTAGKAVDEVIEEIIPSLH